MLSAVAGLPEIAAADNVCVLTGQTGAACIEEADSAPLQQRLPLVLIHGWNRETVPGPPDVALWNNLVAYVRGTPALNRAYKVYRFTYFSNVVPVPTLGRALRDALDEKSRRDSVFRDRELVIVAHSMGGLIGRYFLSLTTQEGSFSGRAGGERVRRLITLGTPHHGSPLANGPAIWDRVNLVDGALQSLYEFFSINSPDWFASNRTDLFWDNYDGVFDYTNRFPSERNVVLDALNRDGRYDSKVVAYAGSITCPGGAAAYCATSGILHRAFNYDSDGVVPLASALYYRSRDDTRSKFARTRTYTGYDHGQIARGRDALDSRLFGDLASDLLEASSAPPATSPQPCVPTSIAVGAIINGQLTDGDCVAPHRTTGRADVYWVQLSAGQRVQISMAAGTLTDPYLLLASPSGGLVAEDDDSGDYLDSLIDYTAVSSGVYVVEASSYGSERGTYTLNIVTAAAGCSVTPLRVGSSMDGALTEADCAAPHRPGRKADVYQFAGQAGQRVTITMSRQALEDPYLVLVAGATVVARDDDSGRNLDSIIQLTLPSTGTYEIEATSYSGYDRGTYRLTLSTGVPPTLALTSRRVDGAKKSGKELASPARAQPRRNR